MVLHHRKYSFKFDETKASIQYRVLTLNFDRITTLFAVLIIVSKGVFIPEKSGPIAM